MPGDRFVFPSEQLDNNERSIVMDDDFENDQISNQNTSSSKSSKTPIINANEFADSKKIVETLVENKSVIVSIDNLVSSEEGMKIATRIIDFTSGATIALNGKIKKINKFGFYFSIK